MHALERDRESLDPLHAREDDVQYGYNLEFLTNLPIRPLFNSHASSAIQAKKARKDLLGNLEAGIQQKLLRLLKIGLIFL